MKDPFPAPDWSIQRAIPFAHSVHLQTLPLHVHQIVCFAAFYYLVYAVVSPILNRVLIPRIYNTLPRHTQINWDIHVVSMVQSLLICGTALYAISKDEFRWDWDFKGRLYGYDGVSGLVQAMAAGYFIWDIWVSITRFTILGPSSLAHGLAAFGVTILGYYPFGNFYGLNFILYELSTPCLNIHWFLDKTGKTGTNAQLINGILLLITFAGCRLVWGTWQSILIYSDVWQAWNAGVLGVDTILHDPISEKLIEKRALQSLGQQSHLDGIPLWLVGLYLVANTLLSCLNFYWYNKMIAAVRKRFDPRKGSLESRDQLADGSASAIKTSKDTLQHRQVGQSAQ